MVDKILLDFYVSRNSDLKKFISQMGQPDEFVTFNEAPYKLEDI
ncbi:hypothetical protein [Limnovirga soli]|nr:hypothetical protein [Limnovirga soli]